MLYNYGKVISILLFLSSTTPVIVQGVELQCRLTKESTEVCLVTKKGDFYNNTVTIVSNKAPEIKHIKIIRVNLGHVPTSSGLRNFRKLEAITFESCNIESLDGLKSLKSVQQIFLNKNNITAIPDAKFNNKVVYIEAQYNKMENISKNAFKNLENLYWIDLSNNRIKKLPRKVFVNNHVLTSINLSNNRIKNIRQVFQRQDNLRFLRLSQNKITKVTTEAFKTLKNLRELDLSHNKITHVDPQAFDACQTLVVLNLANNHLKQLHLTVPSKTLSFLYLMENGFANLTVDFKDKPIRLVLDASNSAEFKVGTSEVMRIKFQKGLPISSLNLANNNLNTVNAIASVSKLQKLILANNTLIGNSSLMRLLTLTDIFEMNLQGVNLTPDQLSIILQLKNLKVLDVSHNKQLSMVNWNSLSNSSVVKLLLNNCHLTAINVRDLKKSFLKLQEIHIGSNNFTCNYVQDLVTKLHSNGIRTQIPVSELSKCTWFVRQ